MTASAASRANPMRVHRLLAIAAAALVAEAGAPAAAQEKSWVGESVLYTKPAKDIKFWDRVDGEDVYFVFVGLLPLKVRDDGDGRLRIHDGHREGWVDKADFVLVRDAPAYFDRR